MTHTYWYTVGYEPDTERRSIQIPEDYDLLCSNELECACSDIAEQVLPPDRLPEAIHIYESEDGPFAGMAAVEPDGAHGIVVMAADVRRWGAWFEEASE
jgi:hypothetical protein